MHDDVDRLLHLLDGYPFEARMEIVLAREQIGRGQPHERQSRSVRPATNGAPANLEPCTSDGFARVLDDLGVPVEHFLHVSIRFLDVDLDTYARITPGRLRGELFDEPFF